MDTSVTSLSVIGFILGASRREESVTLNSSLEIAFLPWKTQVRWYVPSVSFTDQERVAELPTRSRVW